MDFIRSRRLKAPVEFYTRKIISTLIPAVAQKVRFAQPRQPFILGPHPVGTREVDCRRKILAVKKRFTGLSALRWCTDERTPGIYALEPNDGSSWACGIVNIWLTESHH